MKIPHPVTEVETDTDPRKRRWRDLLRGKEVSDITELKRQGLSIQTISELMGFDRKTVRKYLLKPETLPVYGPRAKRASKLDTLKPYLEERLKAGVWNACVLMRELRERGYKGGYTILTDWLRPQRQAASVVAVRRFETPPGHQAQATSSTQTCGAMATQALTGCRLACSSAMVAPSEWPISTGRSMPRPCSRRGSTWWASMCM